MHIYLKFINCNLKDVLMFFVNFQLKVLFLMFLLQSVSKIILMKKIFILAGLTLITASTNAQIVINEIYGGNGNSGAVFKNNYIVLKNIGTTLVSLTGASIQYAPAIGAFTEYHTLPDFTLGPEETYLIQEAAVDGGVEALPTPDFIATTVTNFDGTPNKSVGIRISGTSGKLALAGNICTGIESFIFQCVRFRRIREPMQTSLKGMVLRLLLQPQQLLEGL
jgi:hypothetical protein